MEVDYAMKLGKNTASNTSNEHAMLKNQILEIMKNSSFEFVSLLIDNKHFGNVIIIISNNSGFVRFIEDRGDIYIEKKLHTDTTWKVSNFNSKSDNNIEMPHSKLIYALKAYIDVYNNA